MEILVCISKTPETTAKIAFKDNNTAYVTDGVNFIMNPYDEWYALVRAVELKEANGGKVTLMHVGPAENETIIRKGLAIGADEAVRIDASPQDAFFVSSQIANYVRDNAFDLVLLGKETIDYNSSEVGSMLSELLDWPFASYVNSLDVDGEETTITREVEGGVELSNVSLPIVVSAAKGLAEQRIPNMRGIMMAKRKPLHIIEAVETDTRIAYKSFSLPPVKDGVQMVDPENMDELVRLLHEEAKLI